MTLLLKDGSLNEIILELDTESVTFTQDGAVEEMLSQYLTGSDKRRLAEQVSIEKMTKFDRFTAMAIDGEVFVYDRVAKKNFYKIKSKNAGNIKGQADKLIL